MADGPYISLAQASRHCTFSQDYLNLLIRRGKLKGVKIGRNWVTTREWLTAYLATERKAGRPAKVDPTPSFASQPAPVRVPETAAARSPISFIHSPINYPVAAGGVKPPSSLWSSAVPSPARFAPGSPDKSFLDLSYLRAPAFSLARALAGFVLVSFVVFVAASPGAQGALGSFLKNALKTAFTPFSCLASLGGSGSRSVPPASPELQRGEPVLPSESPVSFFEDADENSDSPAEASPTGETVTVTRQEVATSRRGGADDRREDRNVTDVVERKEIVVPADISSFEEALLTTDRELKLTQQNFELAKGGLESDIEALKAELQALKLQALATPAVGPAIREVIRETVIHVATSPGAAFGSKEIALSIESGAIAPTTVIVGNTTITGTLTVSGTGTSTFAGPLQAATSTRSLVLSGAANALTGSFYPVLLNPYGGNVGVGTTSPNNLLTLYSATTPSLEFCFGVSQQVGHGH